MIISSKPCFVIIKIKINQTLVSQKALEDHMSPRGWLLENRVSGLEKQWEVDTCYRRFWKERILLDRDSEAVIRRGYFGYCYREV